MLAGRLTGRQTNIHTRTHKNRHTDILIATLRTSYRDEVNIAAEFVSLK